ncbi:MAG TPA: MFS transporter [Bryobacteraceae bacterium]|jgi:fucose permease|nr:MFS transporter [Bryobacteraceae bacterium]
MLILSAILAIFTYGLIAPILGALLPSYGLTAHQQGSLAMLYALGLVVASLSAGPFIDIKGSKLAVLTGLALIVASLAAAPNAGGFSGLLVVYFVLGIGGGIVVTGSNALAGAVDPSRRGSVLNFLNLFFGLGSIITTYVASEHIDPAKVCYLIAGLSVIAFLVSAATKMPSPSGKANFQVGEVPGLLGKPQLLLLSLFLFLYVACEVGVWNWLKTYLVETVHFDASAAGHVVSYGFAFGILLGRVVVSRVLIKVPALMVVLTASICMAITTYLMLHLNSNGAITAAVFCAGLSMAPVFPTTLAMAQDAFPRGTATAMSIVITFGWIGLTVSSPIIGALAEGGHYERGLMLIPLFSVLMFLVSLVLRPAMRRPVTA